MNEENLRKKIRSLLDDLKTKADPVMLNRYRSIFRQEVSFFHRSYLAAYLLFLAEGPIEEQSENRSFRLGSGSRKTDKQPREKKDKPVRNNSSFEDSRSDSPHILSEEESVQLFISIGRNRKVFPRDIISLVIARAKLSRDDIGTIRILDNYSFIQVRNSAADTAIEALNGRSFRGRTLTVNYARSRREDEEGQPDDSAINVPKTED